MKDYIIGFLLGIIVGTAFCAYVQSALNKQAADNNYIAIDGVGYHLEKINWEVKK